MMSRRRRTPRMQIPYEFEQFVKGIYPGIPHDWKSL
jgi:hypothetical protein